MLVNHRACGEPLTAELACDRCHGQLTGAQVEVIQAALTRAEAAGNP